ncbi:MAG: bifunctional pyr operon transcriptional regulator/uracil phosphoribosyltransferase PyrR [Trueperella sp.]|nr:bifunctional pyr operon transcriptional regulator/uracil phosphoribosyltransferase PyrR [Trueperella sp.]
MKNLAREKRVFTGDDIARSLRRIGYEIIERHHNVADVVLLGIPSRGVPLAQRLAVALTEASGTAVDVGTLDITLYRDDLASRPIRVPHKTAIPPRGISDRVVILVDDVLYSGRTVRAALDALVDVGRPKAVQLAVLIDRGHRELPIRPDYVGKNLPTSREEQVAVYLSEIDGEDAVILGEVEK